MLNFISCKYVLLSVLLFSLFSCGNSENLENLVTGKWLDEATYDGFNIVDGEKVAVSYPNILFSFQSNGEYQVENELPWGVASNGTWEFDEENQTIELTTDLPEEEIGIDRTYKLKILSIDDTHLETMYLYWGAPLEEGGDPIILEFYRKFKKQ